METEPQLIEQYVKPGKARLVYRHLLQLGPSTQALSEASECAGAQGKFWEAREWIYRNQDDLYGARTTDDLQPLIDALNLDRSRFAQCFDMGEFRKQVEDDYAAAQREGITARPGMDVNGTRIVGHQGFAAFERVLDATR